MWSWYFNGVVREGEAGLTEKVTFEKEASEVREEPGGYQREENCRWGKQLRRECECPQGFQEACVEEVRPKGRGLVGGWGRPSGCGKDFGVDSRELGRQREGSEPRRDGL